MNRAGRALVLKGQGAHHGKADYVDRFQRRSHHPPEGVEAIGHRSDSDGRCDRQERKAERWQGD